MNKLKRFAKALMAIILTVVTCGQAPAVAAAPQKYISEIRLSSHENDAQAKQWLTDNGYYIYDVDLNQKTTEDFVYLGYKTTDDPEQAITDLKVMNMNGGFIINDSSAEIKKMWSDMKNEAEYVFRVVEKFKEAHEEGSPYAQAALTGLNIMTYSAENGGEEIPLGDYFLSGNTNIDDIVKLMFFIDQSAAIGIYSALSLGVLKSDARPWMDKAVDNLLDTEKTYTPEEEDRAEELTPAILALGDLYRAYVEKKENDENISEADLTDEEAVFMTLFADFRAHEFEDTDLGTYLTNPDISFEEILPIAAAISDEQITLIQPLGLMQFEMIGFSRDGFLDDLLETWKEIPSTSVWDGVDRDAYDNPVAVTVEAANEAKMAGGDVSDIFVNGVAFIGYSLAAGAAMLGGYLIAIARGAVSSAKSAVVAASAAMMKNIANETAALNAFMMGSRGTASQIALGQARITAAFGKSSMALEANLGAASSRLAQVSSSSARMVSNTTIIMIVVMVVIMAVVLGIGLYDYLNPSLTAIPYTMFDAKTDENDKTIYTRYMAALSQNGDPADLNAKGGKTWNALYATKDSRAGKPITTDLLHKADSNAVPNGYDSVSFFGYVAPANLNIGAFKGNSHYLFFKRDTNYLSLTGSVFTPPLGFALLGVALVIGLALGAGGMKIFDKRKLAKKQDNAAV